MSQPAVPLPALLERRHGSARVRILQSRTAQGGCKPSPAALPRPPVHRALQRDPRPASLLLARRALLSCLTASFRRCVLMTSPIAHGTTCDESCVRLSRRATSKLEVL